MLLADMKENVTFLFFLFHLLSTICFLGALGWLKVFFIWKDMVLVISFLAR